MCIRDRSITRALRSPFYGKLYRELNISAESIKTYDVVLSLIHISEPTRPY